MLGKGGKGYVRYIQYDKLFDWSKPGSLKGYGGVYYKPDIDISIIDEKDN